MRPPKRRLFRRIAGVVVALVTLAVAVPAIFLIRANVSFLRDKLTEGAIATADGAALAASHLMVADDVDALTRLVATLVHRTPDVEWALVTDRQGIVVAHSATALEGTRIADLATPPTDVEVIELEHTPGKPPLMQVTVPVEVSGEPWGAVRVAVRLASVHGKAVAEVFRVAALALLFIAIGAVGAAVLARSVARPVERLAATAQAVASGDLQARSGVRRADEIGGLAAAFDYMVEALGEARGELERHSEVLEAKVAERTHQLAASEAGTRAIVEAAPDGIVTVRDDGAIDTLNSAAERMFACTSQHAIGRDVREFIPSFAPDAIAALSVLVASTRAAGAGACREETGRRADGSGFALEVSASESSPGDRRLFTLIIRDITARKTAEQELQRLNAELVEARDKALDATRLKSEFLANMSHEIRTPMAGIMGMSDLMLETELSEEQRHFAETVRNSAEALLTIINDILDFSKIEAGRLDVDTIDFDLHATVEDAVELLAERAHTKRLELTCYLEPDVPVAVAGDPIRLRQVLVNLIGNGIKFTEHGEVAIEVALDRFEGAAAVIRCVVRDSGIGIPRGARARLFESFSQADGSTTRKYGGTGLGLAISKRLVELMGGEIGVDSTEGVGTTFWFTLPLERRDAPSKRDLVHLAGLRVLCVDDNATNRRVLRGQLAAWRMEVTEACDGPEALERLRQATRAGKPHQLVILDHLMPGMDGMALARVIKGDPASADVPLLMLASVSERGLAVAAREAGIARRITKPVRRDALIDAIVAVLGAPADADVPAAPAPRPAVAAPVPTPARRVRVLVAEDQPVNQQIVRHQLTKLGYDVDLVSDGSQAVEATASTHYDVVLMDCQMPKMDGFAATRIIREREAGGRHTPIVALTAYAMREDQERCLAAGMDDHLSKPLSVPQLARTLERWTAIVEADAGTTDPVLGALREELGDRPALLDKLIDLFLSSARESCASARDAIRRADAQTLTRAAHALHGGGATMGAERITTLAAELEALGTRGTLEGADAMVASIEAELARVAHERPSEPD